MVQIDFQRRQIIAKIVYYGPGLAGKTTNLRHLFDKTPTDYTGELVTINTESDRTLYFDYLPMDLGTVADMRVRLQLYTAPGQVYYNATRKLVLQGVDAMVFVADSTPSKRHENIASLANMHENLQDMQRDPLEIPLILQYNKRDLRNALSTADLDLDLDPTDRYPKVEAVAAAGQGVFSTLKLVTRELMDHIQRDLTPPGGNQATRRRSVGSGPQRSVEPTPVTGEANTLADATRVAQILPAITDTAAGGSTDRDGDEGNVRDGLLLAQINVIAQQNAEMMQQMKLMQRTVERLAYTSEEMRERLRGLEADRSRLSS